MKKFYYRILADGTRDEIEVDWSKKMVRSGKGKWDQINTDMDELINGSNPEYIHYEPVEEEVHIHPGK